MSEETTPDSDRVVVVRDGLAFRGWTGFATVESIENAVSTFELEISGVYVAAAAALREDQDVQIYLGEDLLIDGVIDDVSIGGDAESLTVKVSGRSDTRDVVDCSAPLGAKNGLTLLALVRWLVADYQIPVVDEAGVGGKIVRSWRAEEGESIFDALDRLGRDHAFMVTDDTAGRLVLTRAGKGGNATDGIARGTAGFLSGDVTRSCAERYSHYEVRGQEVSDADVAVDVLGGAEDVALKRFRRLIVRPERGLSGGDAALRARWEATTRAAKALEASYTLRGFRQRDDALWRKNQIVQVFDPLCGIAGAELLVVEVRRSLSSDAGRLTTLKLAPREAYTPQPAKVDVKAYQYEEPELTDPGELGADDLGIEADDL